ncbi:hypothetical protein MJ560_27620 [Klebsiella pneumoniae]|nr:hypothetical protein MJ560_27620 [Klebsiella pneumoniae]
MSCLARCRCIGGAMLTLVAMTPVVIFYAIAYSWIWPFMTHGNSALTGFMKNAGGRWGLRLWFL